MQHLNAQLSKDKAISWLIKEHLLTCQCQLSPNIIRQILVVTLSCNYVILPNTGQQHVSPLYVDVRLHAIRDFSTILIPQNIQVLSLAHIIDVYGAIKCDLWPLWPLDCAHCGFEAQLLDLFLWEVYTGGSCRDNHRLRCLRWTERTALSHPMRWTSMVDDSERMFPTGSCLRRSEVSSITENI